MTIGEREEKLFSQWAPKRPGFVKDGVVDEESYIKSHPKVMLVLKEVNDTQDGGNWDLREFLKTADYSPTWNVVTRWMRGIQELNTEIPWEKIEKIKQKDRQNYLKLLCVMNLKKAPGGSTTIDEELTRIAEEDKEYLNEQFHIYEPDLVICGSAIVSTLFHKSVKLEFDFKWKMTSRGIWYHEYQPNKYIITYLHPQAHIPGNMMYYTIIDAVKEIFKK